MKTKQNTGFIVHQDLPISIRKKRDELLLVQKEALRLKPYLKMIIQGTNLSGMMQEESHAPMEVFQSSVR